MGNIFGRRDYKIIMIFAVALGALIALGVHIALWREQSMDFMLYLNPWLDAMRQQGPAIVGTDFANYHPPYMYIIWFFSLFIPDNLSVIKFVAILGDVLLALSVYSAVKTIKPRGYTKYFAAVFAMLLPTVLVNSAFWGQCDAFYAACLVFAVMWALKHNTTGMWIMVAVAIAFKTQGIFLVPFALYVTAGQKRNLKGVVYAGIVLLALLAVPLVYGISINQLVHYYMLDVQPMWGLKLLSWWCPNVMAWLPDSQYYTWHYAGIGAYIFTAVGFYMYGQYERQTTASKYTLVKLAALSVMLSTFVLPQMHERYYFPAEVMLLVLAMCNKKWLVAVLLMQIVTLLAMAVLFAGYRDPAMIPYRALSLVVAGIIVALGVSVYKARGIIKNTSEGKE